MSVEEAGIQRELKELKRFLKKDGRSIRIAKDLPKMSERERERALEQHWWEVYMDPLSLSQDDYLTWMGLRLGWYAEALVRLEEVRDSPPR